MRHAVRLVPPLAILVGALAVAPKALEAIERRPLPSFTLTALDNSEVASRDIVQRGRWVLVYVRPGCAPCDTLLRTIDPRQHPDVPPRIVVVVGGAEPAAAAGLAAGYRDLVGTSWLVDRGPSMRAVLPLAGAPVMFGMRDGTIEWSLAGVVPNPESIKSALISWMAGQR